VSAAHSKEDLDFAIKKFTEAKAELGIEKASGVSDAR
jgi:hypothetical protein